MKKYTTVLSIAFVVGISGLQLMAGDAFSGPVFTDYPNPMEHSQWADAVIKRILAGEAVGVDLRAITNYLSNKNISGANLTGVNLSGTEIVDADLSNANLTRANLFGTNLSDTNLSGANLTNVNLENTIVNAGTNVKNAKGLTPDQKRYLKQFYVQNIPQEQPKLKEEEEEDLKPAVEDVD